MADVGPGPPDLIRKRITTEIKRLEHTIESQELQIMETEETISRLQANIAASREQIRKQEGNLAALDRNEEVKEQDG